MTASPLPQDIPVGFAREFGYEFKNETHLIKAFTHTSYVEETPDAEHDNQRLEFLGDAVVGLVVTEALYRRHPDAPEGVMSKMKASLVSTVSLAQAAREADLAKYLLLGNGEEQSNGRHKRRMLANVFEAVVGAIFLDAGLDIARAFVTDALGARLSDATPDALANDYKSALQEHAQGQHWERPDYQVDTIEGPAHEQVFTVSVRVGDGIVATGTGASKKRAEQSAARAALEALTQR